MKNIISIAAALKKIYFAVHNDSDFDTELTELRMHKLLYFAQKRHYMNFGEWLFQEDFEGWIHGPVSKEVRKSFNFLPASDEGLTLEEEYTLREVVYDYGIYATSYLRDLSHEDISYKISRKGLEENERGSLILSKEKIAEDVAAMQELET